MAHDFRSVPQVGAANLSVNQGLPYAEPRHALPVFARYAAFDKLIYRFYLSSYSESRSLENDGTGIKLTLLSRCYY